MAQVTGIIDVKINGQLMRTKEGSAKLKTGGVSRTAVLGSSRVHGYAEKAVASEFECTLVHMSDTDVAQINDYTDATLECLTDTGVTFVINNAFTSEPCELSEGEGDLTLKMMGDAATES